MPASISISPSGDTTGTADSSAIASAISAAGDGGKISLDVGDFFLAEPISLAPVTGFTVSGQRGGVNGHTSRFPGGTNLWCGTAYSGGAVFDIADGSSGPVLEKFSITGNGNMPPNVHGIACHRNVNGLNIREVSIALVTGHGVAYFQGADGVDGDALKMDTVMIQQPGMNGVHRWPADSTLKDVHTQYAGYLDGTGHGFFCTPGSGGNSTLIGCRADLSRGCGYVLDHNGGFGDAIKLIGCSTERNSQDGLLVTNSSATGGDWRVPVIVSGCCFEGDGMNLGAGGDFAAIRVQGRNRVIISGTNTAVNNMDCPAGAPKYALWLQKAGSAMDQAELVEWTSGILNYSTGQGGEAIHMHSQADHLKIGTAVVQVGGYEGTAIKERSGTVVTSGRVATVNTPWAFPNSLIFLTAINGTSPGACFVTDRRTGSFDIQCATTDATVQWQIL